MGIYFVLHERVPAYHGICYFTLLPAPAASSGMASGPLVKLDLDLPRLPFSKPFLLFHGAMRMDSSHSRKITYASRYITAVK